MTNESKEQFIESHIQSASLGLIWLNHEEEALIEDSWKGFHEFSIIRRPPEVKQLARNTICLVYSPLDSDYPRAYLGLVKSKQKVATTGVRIKLIHVFELKNCSPNVLLPYIENRRLQRLFNELCETDVSALVFSKKLGEYVFRGVRANNSGALGALVDIVTGYRRHESGWLLQASVLRDAIKLFGLSLDAEAETIASKQDDTTALGTLSGEHYLLEDRVIEHDARDMPGWDLIASSVTGFAEFKKEQSRLLVFTANRGPIENVTGADLLYINKRLGNAVLVQYKMMEKEQTKKTETGHGNPDDVEWVYRPDKQLDSEVERMRALHFTRPTGLDYRLNPEPFYFKFVRRIENDLTNAGIIIPLAHFDAILNSEQGKGRRGGRRLTYSTLNGRYLRKQEFVGLIHAGYIGTGTSDSSAIEKLVRISLSAPSRTSVVAYEMFGHASEEQDAAEAVLR